MPGQILVPLKSLGRIQEIIPYVEKIAQPGMRVVFLIRYPVNGGLEWFRDHWVTTESVREAILAGQNIMERYSSHQQRKLAIQRLSAVGEALVRRDVEIALEVYPDSWKRWMRSYMRDRNVDLIMLPPRDGLEIMRFFLGMMPFFDLVFLLWSLLYQGLLRGKG